MDDQIVAIYGLCADILDALGHGEDPPQRMRDAEVITTGLGAMLCVRSNFAAARTRLRTSRDRPRMLSRRRWNRRWHRLKDLFLTLCELLGYTWKQLKTDSVSIMDRVPIAVCDHERSISTRCPVAISPARNAIFMGSTFISWSPTKGTQSSAA
jgi:hypothetical protein